MKGQAAEEKTRTIIHPIKDLKPEYMGFPGGSVVKNPPANAETWVRSLSREDPLEKETTTSVFLPGEARGQRSLVDCNPLGHKRARHDLASKPPPEYIKNSYNSIKNYNSEPKILIDISVKKIHE